LKAAAAIAARQRSFKTMAQLDPARIPVIIGVGQVSDRTNDPEAALDTVGLMAAALAAADEDAGGGWLQRLESLFLIDHVSFRAADSADQLAERLGVRPRLLGKGSYPGGETPILLLNEAANRIGAGEIAIAAVAGGEALRTEALRRAAEAPDGRPPNALEEGARRRPPNYRGRYGLLTPTTVYPLYENAGRAAYGQTLAEAQGESAELWSLSSQVAAANPDAWIRTARTPDEILEVSPSNRPIAFPYNKLMVANSSVNMGAAFIVTSLAVARAAGIAEDRLVHVGLGAAANEPDDVLAREGYDRSIGLETAITRTLALNGLTSGDLDHVELYSCFPTIPKMARRVLDWPLDRPTTVYGGLTFGGGPIATPMAHAVACMTQKLRGRPDGKGLIFANGGYANHNHCIVLTSAPNPAAIFPQDFDYQAEADSRRGTAASLDEAYAGPGVIETYTVFYDRAGEATFGVVVGRTPDGTRRFLAKMTDEPGLAFLTNGAAEPVGAAGEAVAGPDGDMMWVRGAQGS
jgi:acetyl-CoA C-acetyltransferase